MMNLGGVGVAGLESMGSEVVFSATSSSELITTASGSGGVGAENEGRFFLMSSDLGMILLCHPELDSGSLLIEIPHQVRNDMCIIIMI